MVDALKKQRGGAKEKFAWLLAPFSFLTIIPAGFFTVQEVANSFFIFPVVGVFTGAVMGSVALFSRSLLPKYISSALSVLALVLVTGANEIDGMVDFCDSSMVVGSS